VALTLCHNFDGWLINIENVVEEKIVGNIVYFLQRLKRELKLAGSNNSQVIWYDSITKEGKLDWQNELNDLNRFFFLNSEPNTISDLLSYILGCSLTHAMEYS